MITVDNFADNYLSGNLDGNQQSQTHGDWTFLQSFIVAPSASRSFLNHKKKSDGTSDAAKSIRNSYAASTGVNAVNLSFGLFDPDGTDVTVGDYTLGNNLWDSIVAEAKAGSAVFVKAAGNTNGGTVDGTIRMRLGGIRPEKAQDVLNLALIGAEGAIFVGALDGNGSVDNQASIASYSTIAGSNTAIQNMFLVVGVEDGATGLAGTSFAAPIVTGYAAILGKKFNANPGQVVDQLLLTAREDTISGYDASIHGQGEASLINALAPLSQPN